MVQILRDFSRHENVLCVFPFLCLYILPTLTLTTTEPGKSESQANPFLSVDIVKFFISSVYTDKFVVIPAYMVSSAMRATEIACIEYSNQANKRRGGSPALELNDVLERRTGWKRQHIFLYDHTHYIYV